MLIALHDMQHTVKRPVPLDDNARRGGVAYNATMVHVARPKGFNDDAKRTMIREWRHFRGLSQDALVERVRAELPGFSKSSLSRLETGKQSYTQPVLEALARSLDCKPSDLITRDPNSLAWSIFDQLLTMNEETQAQIGAIVETFRKAS